MSNENGVHDAKQEVATNCRLEDVEICYTGIQEIYTVDEYGTWCELKETYTMDSEPSYYYCDGCKVDWHINDVQDIERCWELVKAHLKEDKSE